MNDSAPLKLLGAAVVVAALAATLVVRVAALGDDAPRAVPERSLASSHAPPAVVPEPQPIVLGDLPTPTCWSCSRSKNAPLAFGVDLDLIAPLGDGPANAALWLADFAKPHGRRLSEIEERRITRELRGMTWKVLPGDDPLLLEAEGWIDQARCSFYPEVWGFEGIATPIPNLLFTLTLARSWVLRGHDAADAGNAEAAAADYRRAIRLGRLLRQDDFTLIQELVAYACIGLGAEALYELARDAGDAPTMAAAALVLADKDAMRHVAAKRVTVGERAIATLRSDEAGGWVVEPSPAALEELTQAARGYHERCFRIETTFPLAVVAHFAADEASRTTALEALEALASSDDAFTAQAAREALEAPPNDEVVEWMGVAPTTKAIPRRAR